MGLFSRKPKIDMEEAQKNKVQTLQAALENASSSFGEAGIPIRFSMPPPAPPGRRTGFCLTHRYISLSVLCSDIGRVILS